VSLFILLSLGGEQFFMAKSLRKKRIVKNKTFLTGVFWLEVLALCFVMFMMGYIFGEYL